MELLIWLWSYDCRWLFGYYGGRTAWWLACMLQSVILISSLYLGMTGCGMNYSILARVFLSSSIILNSALVATVVRTSKVNPGRIYAVSLPGMMVLLSGLMNLGLVAYEYVKENMICEEMYQNQMDLQNGLYFIGGAYIITIAVLWFVIKIGCIVCAACMPRFYIRIKSN